jgi:DNA (cytosine-5)-methyltransferase 1
MAIKVLNLYSGIGGNRKLWTDVEVTAIENVPEIAKIYQDFFPNDKVIVTDAHQYLLDHFKEFDFIWSSPPCPTHSRINFLNNEKIEKGITPKFPDMKLYEEIILLKTWFDGLWVVENVISYYDPLIKPFKSGTHYFWSNFIISDFGTITRGIREDIHFVEKKTGFNIDNYTGIEKRKILNNCVEPKLGLHIFNCAYKSKQNVLFEGEIESKK